MEKVDERIPYLSRIEEVKPPLMVTGVDRTRGGVES